MEMSFLSSTVIAVEREKGGGRRVSFVSYGGEWDFRTL
jgi:hypothetical protein